MLSMKNVVEVETSRLYSRLAYRTDGFRLFKRSGSALWSVYKASDCLSGLYLVKCIIMMCVNERISSWNGCIIHKCGMCFLMRIHGSAIP